MTLAKLGLWPMRALWFVLLVVSGYGFSEILHDVGSGVGTMSEILLWAAWFVGLVALLAPSTVALTVFRSVAPASLLGPLLGAVLSGTWHGAVFAAIGIGLLVTVLALSPQVGDVMVNGSSYGPERRLALRTPASLLMGPIQLTWLILFFSVISGPLLLASGHYIIGAIAGIIGAFLGAQMGHSLHSLSRRWVVFVPAGFVIHDFWVLAESILFRRPQIRALGPAALDIGNFLDLSANAQGLALMVQLDEKVPLALRAKKDVQTFSAHRLVFSPSLPGVLMHEARVRGIKIGSDPELLDDDPAETGDDQNEAT